MFGQIQMQLTKRKGLRTRSPWHKRLDRSRIKSLITCRFRCGFQVMKPSRLEPRPCKRFLRWWFSLWKIRAIVYIRRCDLVPFLHAKKSKRPHPGTQILGQIPEGGEGNRGRMPHICPGSSPPRLGLTLIVDRWSRYYLFTARNYRNSSPWKTHFFISSEHKST